MSNKKPLTARLAHEISFLENLTVSEIEEPKWEQKFNCYAEIIPLSDCQYMNIEGLNFGNFITEEYYLFKIRYMDKINKKMRVSFGKRIYSIKRIVNIREKNRILNIIAHEIL